ncbi:hypothetical protein KAU33_00420 [Candidatus Dependentiae bacterium]|nr:hypothetical protein [Candidatus Dependentiae bacterium]
MKKITLEEVFYAPDFRAGERLSWNMQIILKEKEFTDINQANEYLQNFIGKEISNFENMAPRDKAQNLIYDAFESDSNAEKIKLAKQALEIYPDTADAYVLLAENSDEKIESVIELYRKGVKAGKKSINPKIFKSFKTNLYSAVTARPYLRAKYGLGESLLEAGQEHEGLEELYGTIKVNKSDNLGARFVIYNYLILNSKRIKEFNKVFSKFENDSCSIYAKALYLYSKHGICSLSNKMLNNAIFFNPYVSVILTESKFGMEPIDIVDAKIAESKAMNYVKESYWVWSRIEGAIDWVADFLREKTEFTNEE